MTTPRKPATPVSWQTIERVADSAERERLAALSEEEIDRELAEAGVDPQEAVSLVQRAIDEDREKGSAPRTDPPPGAIEGRRRPRRDQKRKRDRRMPWIWITPAVAVAAAVLLLIQARQPYETSSGNTPERRRQMHERAAKVRESAYAACAQRAFAECGRLLDIAKAADPDGDADPAVQAARKAIDEANPKR